MRRFVPFTLLLACLLLLLIPAAAAADGTTTRHRPCPRQRRRLHVYAERDRLHEDHGLLHRHLPAAPSAAGPTPKSTPSCSRTPKASLTTTWTFGRALRGHQPEPGAGAGGPDVRRQDLLLHRDAVRRRSALPSRRGLHVCPDRLDEHRGRRDGRRAPQRRRVLPAADHHELAERHPPVAGDLGPRRRHVGRVRELGGLRLLGRNWEEVANNWSVERTPPVVTSVSLADSPACGQWITTAPEIWNGAAQPNEWTNILTDLCPMPGSLALGDAQAWYTWSYSDSAATISTPAYAFASALNPAASGQNLSFQPEAGASVSYSFVGSTLKWLYAKGPGGGTATVVVDGVSRGTVDQYAADTDCRWQLTLAGLDAGGHIGRRDQRRRPLPRRLRRPDRRRRRAADRGEPQRRLHQVRVGDGRPRGSVGRQLTSTWRPPTPPRRSRSPAGRHLAVRAEGGRRHRRGVDRRRQAGAGRPSSTKPRGRTEEERQGRQEDRRSQEQCPSAG